jgi:4-hydroxy-3-methylbut-2-enyl diphosphate reductase IspH
VKKVAPQVEAMIVVGSPNSSNSQRLREVAEREGCKVSVLVQRASELDWSKFEGIKTSVSRLARPRRKSSSRKSWMRSRPTII